jgi:hypothetical protein
MEIEQVYTLLSERIINIIRDQFGSVFKAYFLGEPEMIPEAALPCVVVQKISGDVQVGATMTDIHTDQVVVHILVNGKDGFGTPDNEDNISHELEVLVEGLDETTGTYIPTSLMYAIRHNLTLDSTVIDHVEKINYGATPRVDQPTIREAVITVTAETHVLVPNRY